MELADASRFIRVDQEFVRVDEITGRDRENARVVGELVILRHAPLEREQDQHEHDDETAKHFPKFYGID